MNLANIYAGYELPEIVQELVRLGRISFRKAKMLSFKDEVKLTNAQISEYMSLKPSRSENESREDYKNRMVFSKQLLKFRPYIYDFNKMDKSKVRKFAR